jgi:hypothetical protein
MSSRRLAVALAAIVLLSGCSMLPGGGGGGDSTSDGPAHHEFAFASNTGGVAFEATVTVEKDGSVLHEQTVAGDGNGTFVNLTALEEPGPYTVTVNTTIPAAGGEEMSKQRRVNGTLGSETVVDVTYRRIAFETVSLPRQELAEPLYLQKLSERPTPKRVVVEYEGERIAAETVERDGHGPFEVADLRETGVYQVSMAGGDGEWTNRTVVLTHPEQKLLVDFVDGDHSVDVYAPDAPLPGN